MATEFVIKRSEKQSEGFDVLARDLMSFGEYQARFNHMVFDMGWQPYEAAAELYAMAPYIPKSESPHSYGLVAEFVFSYVESGDILIIEGRYFVVNQPAEA